MAAGDDLAMDRRRPKGHPAGAMAARGSQGRATPKEAAPADTPADAIVVGGGMVGGALALALAGGGLEVALVDRTPPEALAAAAHDGRSSAIAYASQKLLAQIGLWREVAHAAEPIRDIRVSDGASLLFLHYRHREPDGPADGAPMGWIVANDAIRSGLAALLAAAAGIRVVAPARAQRLMPGEPGDPLAGLALEDGRVLRAPLIVAADGTESRLRTQARIAATQWRYPQDGIVCTMAHELPHDGIAHERFLPAGPFAVLPMTDAPDGTHRSSIVWTERARHAPAMMRLSDAAFGAELQRRFGDWYGAVRATGGRWRYPLRLLHADRYVAPRFALVGDAAHTIHPIAGQGLNLGLRDVAALAEAVVDDRRLGLDHGGLATLQRYERWRRPDNVTLMAVTDGLNRLFSNDIGPVRLARDLGLAAVDRMPGLKRLFMQHAMGTVGRLPRLLRGEAL